MTGVQVTDVSVVFVSECR